MATMLARHASQWVRNMITHPAYIPIGATVGTITGGAIIVTSPSGRPIETAIASVTGGLIAGVWWPVYIPLSGVIAIVSIPLYIRQQYDSSRAKAADMAELYRARSSAFK